MSEGLRTANGGRIDRSRPLSFRFDGVCYRGYAGDTLASALLANGVHLMGRSFKYHRPRGVLAAGAEEPNALVTVERDAARTTPNIRATQLELYRNLNAHSQNRWPDEAQCARSAWLALPLDWSPEHRRRAQTKIAFQFPRADKRAKVAARCNCLAKIALTQL